MKNRKTYSFFIRSYGRLIKALYCKHFSKKGVLYADKNCKFLFEDNSRIEINKKLILSANAFKHNGRSSIIRLDRGAKFCSTGVTKIFYGADIICFSNAVLTIGNSFINSDCKIRCHKKISIGDGCAISHDVTIMDSDAHVLDGEKRVNPVVIEDKVWIGSRVLILNGVTIGSGSVVAAGSVVTNDVPPQSLVAGVPGRIIRGKVEWRED